jgi:exodeoxyribonuclease VII large subunit
MDERQARLRAAARALPRPDDLLAIAHQRLDAAAGRLAQALRANTHIHAMQFQRTASRLTLQPVKLRISACDERLTRLSRQAQRAIAHMIEARRNRLAAEAKLLASLSYRSVLQRGFALVRDAAGRPKHLAADIRPGEELELEFADGLAPARALAPSGAKQGSLF